MNTEKSTPEMTPWDLDKIYHLKPKRIGIVSIEGHSFRMTIEGKEVLKKVYEENRGLAWTYVGYPVSEGFIKLFGPDLLEKHREGAKEILSGKQDSVEGLPKLLCKELVRERKNNKDNKRHCD